LERLKANESQHDSCVIVQIYEMFTCEGHSFANIKYQKISKSSIVA